MAKSGHRKKLGPPPDEAFVPFPIQKIDASNQNKFTAIFNGFFVEIYDPEQIKNLHTCGCFGQGSLSRSTPRCVRGSKEIVINRRAFERHQEWSQKFGNTADGPETCLVVADDININEIEQLKESGTHVEKEVTKNVFPIAENLTLFLEEAFFLHFALKCLEIRDLEGRVLTTEEIFDKFVSLKPKFLSQYVAYQYLRAKGWVVKSGIKFGGDFLLYKYGPSFYHAQYIALVFEPDETFTGLEFAHHYRIGETTAKELVQLTVHRPDTSFTNQFKLLQQIDRFHVAEICMKRFSLRKEGEVDE